MFKYVIIIRFRKVSSSVRHVRKLNRSKKYAEAIQFAEEKLNRKYIYQPLNLMKYLAALYKRFDRTDEANLLSKKILKNYSNLDSEVLIKNIEKKNEFNHSIHSTYMFQGGAENLGVVIHSNDQALYFTKVLPYFTWHENREIEFYHHLNKDFSELSKFIPIYKSSHRVDQYNVQYLTTNFIDKQEIDLEYLNHLIEFDAICRSIKYKSIHMNQGSYHAQFRLLHDPILINTIGLFLKTNLSQTSLSEQSSLVYNNIKRISKLIIPEYDYCFIHNDLHHKNVFWDKIENRLVIMDWNTYGWGLKGIDIVRFVSHFSFDFEWFRTQYLVKQNEERSRIQNIMLVFLLVYAKYLQDIDITYTLNTFYQPALEWINSESEMV
jgi:hypothetical protein